MWRNESGATEGYNERRVREAALRRQSLRQAWPTLVMIPILIGIMHAATFSLLVELFLHESFGLSRGNPSPWAGGIAVIFLISFWTNRVITRLPFGNVASQIATLVAWFVTWIAWVAIEPTWRNSDLWIRPGELVRSESHLIVPLLMSMGIWWSGLNYAASVASVSAEDIRGSVQRSWLVLIGSILLAVFAGGDPGRDALLQARIAVPLLLIVSLALVAGAEVESTRRVALRRGAQPPGWGRWLRLTGGITAAVLVLTLVVLALLSPGALDALVGGILLVARFVASVIGYILLAIIWAIFQVVILIADLFNAIFGDVFGPIEAPEMPAPPMGGMEFLEPPEEQGETEVWPYAILLRWIALGIVIAVVALLLFRVTRRRTEDDDDLGLDEQRDNVFSADLARQQLRDLFRRRNRGGRARRLDLDQPPGSVRETMLYLETLAWRQGVERSSVETPEDFAARLRASWPGTASALVDFPRRYERIRYGETPDQPGSPEHEAAIRDWQLIWSRRKDAPPPAKADDD